MVEYALSHRKCMGMDEGFKSFDPDVEHDFVQEIRNFIASGDSFFTAPPVPEIKFPDSKSPYPDYVTTKYDWIDWFISETKRLNGLGE